MIANEFFSVILEKGTGRAVHQGERQDEIGVVSQVPPQGLYPEIRSYQVVD
jgi:hypothetical protein